jgi:leucine dehydrogenase
VINAGGIISIESEVYKETLNDAAREAKVRRIGETLKSIFEASDREEKPTGIIANKMAENIIENAAKAKQAA